MKTPFIGQAYTARSKNLAYNRLVNLYTEAAPEGKDIAGFFGCPGLTPLVEVGTGPIRGAHVMAGVLYVVSGTALYSVDASYTATELGTVGTGGPVSMDDNGTQLFIATDPDAFIYNEGAGTFAQITDPDFPGAVTVQFIDGYFLFNQPQSGRFYITAINDGSDIDALDFATAEGAPDNIVSVLVDHREAWLFGALSVEVWFNSGNADFPFERIQGAFIETGCAAPYSPAKMDNSIFWLGADARGQGIVWRANGYTPQRVSTHSIELAINGYADISDAIGFSYQQEGHQFYVLTFPTGNATWVFDAATNLWHERAWFKSTDGSLNRHRANSYAFCYGKHIVGDWEDGNLYAWDLGVYTDNGDYIKALRSWRALPQGQNNLARTFQHALQLECESGVGLDGGVQGSDPQLMLRWSDDGGHTWSNEHWRSAGLIGEYGHRVIWRRLGSTEKLRDRVYEISMTDPVKRAWTGAQLLATASKGF